MAVSSPRDRVLSNRDRSETTGNWARQMSAGTTRNSYYVNYYERSMGHGLTVSGKKTKADTY